MGDAVNAVPVLMTLKKKLPESRITFMIASPLVELFAGQPYADEVMAWQPGLLPLSGILRRGKYTHVLMLHPSKALAWAAFFAGVESKAGLGFKPYYPLTGFKTAHLAKDQTANHESQYNLAVARRLFKLPKEIEAPRIFLSDKEIAEAKNILLSMNVNNPIAILPANRGSSANWLPERWGELVRKLAEVKKEVILIGGPGEEKILEQTRGGANVPIIGPDMSLRRLAAILANCRQVVGSSTGTLHLAAAAGARTVGLFCPAPASRPERWRPLGEGHVQLVPKEEFCKNCQPSVKCDLNGMTVEEVFKRLF